MLSNDELIALDDEEILYVLHEAKLSMSFYNAAEGDWRKESDARDDARFYMNKVNGLVLERNLVPLEGEYLL